MREEHLIQAIHECDLGQLEFNQGLNTWSFLFKKRWYPLLATINRARELNRENRLTTYKSGFELFAILHYVRIEMVSFENNRPVEITPLEAMNEIKKTTMILKSLSERWPNQPLIHNELDRIFEELE